MKKLSTSRKLAYSTGGLALNFANLLISQWLLRLYAPDRTSALVPPVLFSIVFLAGRIMDGVTEPLIGYASDRTRSRWGKRMPFIMFALVPTALVSALMWVPPMPDGLHWQNAVYIAVLVQLFFVLWSTLANPYMSLLPQLSDDKAERVDISTMQAVFLMVGTILSAAIGNIKESFGWAGLGVTVFLVTVVAFLPTIIWVRDPSAPGTPQEGSQDGTSPALQDKAEPPEESIKGGMYGWVAEAFRNRPFVFLLASTALFWYALNTMILLVPFWVQHVAGKGDGDVIFVMIPYIAANVVGFLACNALSRRLGKRGVYLAGVAASCLVLLGLAVAGGLPIDQFLAAQVLMAVFGLATSPFMVLPNAFLADVVDYDAARNGLRREAIHFGVQAFFQKIAIGLSIVVSSALMYAGGDRLPTVLGLRLVAACAAVAALASALVFLFYPLRDAEDSRKG